MLPEERGGLPVPLGDWVLEVCGYDFVLSDGTGGLPVPLLMVGLVPVINDDGELIGWAGLLLETPRLPEALGFDELAGAPDGDVLLKILSVLEFAVV